MPSNVAVHEAAPERSRTEVRARILDAAWTIGEASTSGRLTIRNIAAHAGVSAALLYCYFEGKDALVRELRGLAQPRLEDLLRRALDGADTPTDRIARVCTAYVRFARRHRWLCVATPDDRARSCRSNTLTDAFVGRLAPLLDSHGAGAEAAAQIHVAIEGLLAADVADPEDAHAACFVDSYVRMLVRGLDPQATS